MEFWSDGRPSDSPLIETVWQARTDSAGSFISTASINSEIVVSKFEGRTMLTVRGPETKASLADFPAGAEFFGIVFKLGTFMPTFPARMLMDRRDLTLPEANSYAIWLNGSAWQIPSYDNADTFVARLARDGLLVTEPVVAAALNGELTDLSLRSVQRRFVHATGLTHATIRQIERANEAMTLLQAGTPILDVVDQLGYADQPHLTRALRRYAGQTPAQLLRAGASE